MQRVARQAACTPPPLSHNGRMLICSIPPACFRRSAYGVLVWCCGEAGPYLLVLTHKARQNFNNPESHGGDEAYVSLRYEDTARDIAARLSASYDPARDLARWRHRIRTEGEHAYHA